jgi:hypothetical protein
MNPGKIRVTDSTVISGKPNVRVEGLHVVSTSSKSAWAALHQSTTTAAGTEIFLLSTGINDTATISASAYETMDLLCSGDCAVITGANFNYAVVTYVTEP